MEPTHAAYRKNVPELPWAGGFVMKDLHPASQRALPPVEPEPGVLVHPTADRRLAVEHWLLSTLPSESHGRARVEWQEYTVAFLPLGTLFSAVRIPGRLVYALARSAEPAVVDAFLKGALDGGPVICDPPGHRYYALVPGSMPAMWSKAAAQWRSLGVDCLGRGTTLGVPRVSAVEFNPVACVSYWSVPMESLGTLCAPVHVARLVDAARHRLTEEPEA